MVIHSKSLRHQLRASSGSGCGTAIKTLLAPIPNARDYEGQMYCMSCNPRFFAVDMHFSCLERLVS